LSRGDSYWSGAEWAEYHERRRAEVTRRFGGIDEDLEATFLHLDEYRLERLLRDYGDHYGRSAAAYARKTVPKWRDGSVLLSGQTALRLLEFLPLFLSQRERFELIRKLRQHFIRRSTLKVGCSPTSWREKVEPAVAAFVSRSAAVAFPAEVMSVARWLTHNDSLAADALLAEAEREEARTRTEFLAGEFRRIELMLEGLGKRNSRAVHTIQLPQGEIRVIIRRREGGWTDAVWSLFDWLGS